MIIIIVNTAFFLILTSQEIQQNYKKARNCTSDSYIFNYKITQKILYISILSLFILLILYFLTGNRLLSIDMAYQIIRWCMTASIYILAYLALKRPEYFLFVRPGKEQIQKTAIPMLTEDTSEQKNNFKTLRDSVLKEKLLELMEVDKPYLSENLSLQILADKVGVHPKMLSNVINAELGASFFDL
jgi:hypothetical protein